jgi:shikimate dehydrogenase
VRAPLTFALLGHPVEHSVSPAMCEAGFRALGLTYDYVARDLRSRSDLVRAVHDLRSGALAGANVTLPYKRLVLELADEVAESARAVGAANVLVVDESGQIVAHNTDASALADDVEALAVARPYAPHRQAAILGGGGAAMAAIVACKRLGYKLIGVTSRSWTDSTRTFELPAAEQARALGALTFPWPSLEADGPPSGNLSQSLRLHFRELCAQADLVIQATSAGMSGADPGEELSEMLPWPSLPRHAMAYDVVYNPPETPFLRDAAAQGLRTSSGLGMLARQAALAIRLWTGQSPPLDVLRASAEAALDVEPNTDRYWTR